jgi:hypothetical protein
MNLTLTTQVHMPRPIDGSHMPPSLTNGRIVSPTNVKHIINSATHHEDRLGLTHCEERCPKYK